MKWHWSINCLDMNLNLFTLYKPLVWLLLLLFVIFYPMLISIYVFLPLFIGVISYVLIRGLERGNFAAVLIAIIYTINLEVNLSLPLFFILIVTLLFYVVIYPSLTYFHKCKVCTPLLSVLFVDLLYLASLFAYDFVFQTQSIFLDTILLYSLIVDMLIVVIL